MPYKSASEFPPALKSFKPPLSVEQADAIAGKAEAITDKDKNGWAIAISQFKKSHTVRNRRWVERKTMTKPKEADVVEEKLEAPLHEARLNEMYDVDTGTYVPFSVTSFAQLKVQQEAEEVACDVRKTTNQYTAMLWNIMLAPGENKLEAVRMLSDEFMGELATVLDAPAEEVANQSAEMPKGGDPIISEVETPVALSESFEGAVVLQEDAGKPDVAYLDVQIIRPGWGNSRDNNYYPREMLEKHAGAFAGAKMYETDHRDNEKSTRTWVSSIESITGFTDDGAPIARVAVHDPGFAQRLCNLNAAGMLEKMECSILANGTAKGGFEQGGRKGKIIESITEVGAVDWVTRAGAGGHAMKLAESEPTPEIPTIEAPAAPSVPTPDPAAVTEAATAPAGTQVPEPVHIHERDEQQPALAADQIQTALAASRLPVAAMERLKLAEYRSLEDLKQAIARESAYIKELTGSGKPFGMSETETPTSKPVSLEEINARKDAVNKKYLRNYGGN